MEPQPASASRSVLVRWMGIQDANHGGFVHGGTVMKLCDEVAGLAAIRHSRCRVVTGGVDRMIFLEPSTSSMKAPGRQGRRVLP